MFFRVLILISMMFLIPFTASSAKPANSFSVEVLPAKGQNDFSEGYFNLDSEPGGTLSLDFRVTNNSEEPIRLQLQPVNAHTANKGGILYSADQPADEEGHVHLAELIEVQDAVRIEAGAAEDVHFHVAIPENAAGTLLGGIMLTSDEAPEEAGMESSNKGGSNYTFEQTGQRLVAIKLNLPQKTVSAGFSVDKAKFNAGENRVTLKVKNGEAAVLENVQGTYTVMDKDGEVLTNGVLEPFAMSPLSAINFPIDLNGLLLEKGRYVLMLKGRAGEKEFFAEEKFSVTESQEAGILAQSAESKPSAGMGGVGTIIAIASCLILLPLVLFLYRRYEKKAFMRFSEKNNM